MHLEVEAERLAQPLSGLDLYDPAGRYVRSFRGRHQVT
ncbi:uncharacterized protein METZ01_LOCUS452246 [marine metagenome]|uniref:Uncharacterized protein n=1 Tax=marine metagenome TaxID=408172 RepID=A0A382ZV87_9ZZZZ